MPVISMFYGLIVMMYFFDNKKHSLPHIHVKYQNDEAVFAIETGTLLEGKLPKIKSNSSKLGLKFTKKT
jgi:hypothetical protein